MFGNYRAINIKQLPDCLLGKPNIAVLNPDFNGIGRVVFFGKDEKISRTVADLQFFSYQKCPLSVLSMPLKNHMDILAINPRPAKDIDQIPRIS